IAARAQTDVAVLRAPLERLIAAGRVHLHGDGDDALYEAKSLVIPIGAPMGWEAAVFDHFKAVTKTILVRLANHGKTDWNDDVGGSTYTIDIWPGHPLAEEVRGTLGQMRTTLSDLRQRVIDYNKTEKRPEAYERVVIYAGQSVVSEGRD